MENNRINIEKLQNEFYVLSENILKWVDSFVEHEKVRNNMYETEPDMDSIRKHLGYKLVGKDEVEVKPKQKSFEECIEQCDYDVQCRFDYIHNELCSVDDEILEVAKRIEEVKVEIEIEKVIGKGKSEVVFNEMEYIMLKDRMSYLEERYEILEDLYDDMISNILM